MLNEYIKKSDVLELIEKYDERNYSEGISLVLGGIENDISTLPTINPEEVLEEMIEEQITLMSDFPESKITILCEHTINMLSSAIYRIHNQ